MQDSLVGASKLLLIKIKVFVMRCMLAMMVGGETIYCVIKVLYYFFLKNILFERVQDLIVDA